MKKTKKEKPVLDTDPASLHEKCFPGKPNPFKPKVTLYDVWKAGVTERVILDDGRDVRLKSNTCVLTTPVGAVECGTKANVEFTPNGEWCRFDNDRLWVETKKSVVAYEFIDPKNVTSTSSATMTTSYEEFVDKIAKVDIDSIPLKKKGRFSLWCTGKSTG